MVRFVIIGIVIAVAFTLYALVDAAMTDGARARGVAKPVWVVLIVVLPVIGALLWFTIGKGSEAESVRKAPDDDPRFTGTRMSNEDLDAHMRDLEARLRELDDEVFPGEPDGAEADGALGAASNKPQNAGDVSPKSGGSAPRGTVGGSAAGSSGLGTGSGAADGQGTSGPAGTSGADAGSSDRPDADRQ